MAEIVSNATTLPEIARDLGVHPSALTPSRLDSNESLFFARELEMILPEVVVAEKGRLNFIDLLPVKPVDLGVQSITFRSQAGGGKAEFLGPKSGDLPTANLLAAEDTVRYRMLGIAVMYSYEELRAAAYAARNNSAAAGASLERDLLREGRRAIEEKVNACAWGGDRSAGIVGLLQHPQILHAAAANALRGSTTADQCLSVLNAGANGVPNNSEQAEEADTALLPPLSFQYVSQLQRSTASDASVLDFWLKTNGYVVAAQKVRELEAAPILVGGTETASTSAIYYRKDPAVLELPYSGIEVLPPQQVGLNYLVIMLAKVGSLLVKRPRAIFRQTGV